MTPNWQISSQVSDIFEPTHSTILGFIKTVDHIMNSNTFLLKGTSDKSITSLNVTAFFTEFRANQFIDLFLEFDHLSEWHNYHQWHNTPASETNFSVGYIPWLKELNNPQSTTTFKQLSYLDFIGRLYWMLRIARCYYPDHVNRPDDKTAYNMISGVSQALFDDSQVIDNTHPNHHEHPWTFYDVAPDFLYHTTDNQQVARDNGYFDGRTSDSCTLFFRDKVFYVLLTNGAP